MRIDYFIAIFGCFWCVSRPRWIVGAESISKSTKPANYSVPVAFVYTVVPSHCAAGAHGSGGLPQYIKVSIEQAIFSQPDCEVILASNVGECPSIAASVSNLLPHLTIADASAIASNRTKQFQELSSGVFQSDNPLWVTSALRFFIMEDLMRDRGFTELIHVEADNMLYGKFSSFMDTLRTKYLHIAATPLNTQKTFITASVFWVNNLAALVKFNDFLYAIGANTDDAYKKYLTWLRPYACCRHGGIDADANGQGIKPFAVNEMSMLGYYNHLYPQEFLLFPVVPKHKYNLNRYVIDMATFSPGGSEAGPATGEGIWDPNSWGQLIGGTSNKKGRDKGFTDPTHIAGQAIRTTHCVIKMLCANRTIAISPETAATLLSTDALSSAVTATNFNSNGENSSGLGKGASQSQAVAVVSEEMQLLAKMGLYIGGAFDYSRDPAPLFEQSVKERERRRLVRERRERRRRQMVGDQRDENDEKTIGRVATGQRSSKNVTASFEGPIYPTQHRALALGRAAESAGAVSIEAPSACCLSSCGQQSPYYRDLNGDSDGGALSRALLESTDAAGGSSSRTGRLRQRAKCYTAPFVRCSDTAPWTPLWNLHVHSKHTQNYRSTSCECSPV